MDNTFFAALSAKEANCLKDFSASSLDPEEIALFTAFLADLTLDLASLFAEVRLRVCLDLFCADLVLAIKSLMRSNLKGGESNQIRLFVKP